MSAASREVLAASAPVTEADGPPDSPKADPDPARDPLTGLSRQNLVYRRTMAVCDKVAAAAVQGADAAELIRILARTAGKTVVLLDAEFRPRTQAGNNANQGTVCWDPADSRTARLSSMLAAERRPLRVPPMPGSALTSGCLATPIVMGEAILGYLLLLDESASAADDIDLIVASYAATLMALTLARERASLELGQRYQGAVIDSLVSGHFLDSRDARRKARILGMSDTQPYRVAVARLSTAEQAPGAATVGKHEPADALLARVASSLQTAAAVRGMELVLLLPENPRADTATRGDGKESARTPASGQLLPWQQTASEQLTWGISELTLVPELAPQAFLQAQQAIDLGIRIGRGGQTISYEELGIYRLLLQIGDLHKLLQYAEDILGPLIDYDARHKLDLVGTLSIYLNQHESLKQTARVLRVHVNTVSYRIQRIEALTSLDLANPDHRLSAHVATKIIESQHAAERNARTLVEVR
jgi:sugar diacid utilization regulator